MIVLLCISGSLMFAIAAVIQQFSAAKKSLQLNLKPSLIFSLAKEPLWLLGILASICGFAFQSVALYFGSLSVVQALFVLGLVFALPISAFFVHKANLRPIDWFATVLTSGSLATFLLVAEPKNSNIEPSNLAWVILGLITVLVTFPMLAISKNMSFPVRAVAQASCAGIFNSLTATYTKGLLIILRRVKLFSDFRISLAITQVLRAWQFYAVILTTIIVLLLVQSAFQNGPIGWSLPALTVVNPVVSVLIAKTMFAEHSATSGTAIAIQLASLPLMFVGITILAKSPYSPGQLAS